MNKIPKGKNSCVGCNTVSRKLPCFDDNVRPLPFCVNVRAEKKLEFA